MVLNLHWIFALYWPIQKMFLFRVVFHTYLLNRCCFYVVSCYVNMCPACAFWSLLAGGFSCERASGDSRLEQPPTALSAQSQPKTRKSKDPTQRRSSLKSRYTSRPRTGARWTQTDPIGDAVRLTIVTKRRWELKRSCAYKYNDMFTL